MASFHPRAEDLPGEIPVFPLAGALLLPRGKLPLNIFEPRYLAMTEDALGQGRMFGMIQPDPTVPDADTGPGLFHVGCLGRLTSFSETDDRRYLITLTGVIRFAIAGEVGMRRGYRRVNADFTRFVADLNLEPQAIGVQQAKLGVHPGRGGLYSPEPPDDRDGNPLVRDREVVYCLGRLHAPQLLIRH